MPKSIIQAKKLLMKYSKHEIIQIIDTLIDSGHRFSSLGYVLRSGDDVIAKIKQHDAKANIKEQFAIYAKESQTEVLGSDEDSSKRNREKSDRFGIQSRLREKYHFDLFEGTRQAD